MFRKNNIHYLYLSINHNTEKREKNVIQIRNTDILGDANLSALKCDEDLYYHNDLACHAHGCVIKTSNYHNCERDRHSQTATTHQEEGDDQRQKETATEVSKPPTTRLHIWLIKRLTTTVNTPLEPEEGRLFNSEVSIEDDHGKASP